MEMNSIKKFFLALLVLTSLVSSVNAAENWAPKWNYTTDAGVMAIAIDDIDNDGFPEIAVATTSSTLLQGGITGYFSWLYVLDKDGNEEWNRGSDVFGGGKINSLLIEDLQGDGKKEIIVGCGAYIHFFDGSGNAGQKIHLGSKYEVMNLVVADVNNDNNKDLVIASQSAQGGSVYIYNKDKKESSFEILNTAQKMTAFYAGDINNDGAYEYATGTTGRSNSDPAFVYGYDSFGNLLWNYKTTGAVTSLGAEDIDGDKIKELLAGGNGFVNAFDGTGALKKNTPLTGALINKIIPYDLNKDGENEIIAGGNRLYVLDNNLGVKWVSDSTFTKAYKIGFYDLDSDGFPEILFAANGLYIFSKDSGKETDSIFPESNSVNDFVLSDLNGDDYPEIVLGLSGKNLNGEIIGRVYAMSSQRITKGTDADRMYNKALNLFNSGNHTITELLEAEKYAKNAQSLYFGLNDNQGKTDTKNLLDRITAAKKINENITNVAEGYYNISFNAFTSNDMVTARSNAMIARDMYLRIGDSEDVKRCEDIINPATESVKLDATESLSKAQNYLAAGQFNDALVYANKSIGLFTLLSDAENKEKARVVLEQAEDAGGVNVNVSGNGSSMLPGLDGNALMMILFGAIGVALLLAIVYLFSVIRRRRRTPHLRIIIPEDDRKDNLLDDVEKDEKAKEKKRPKKVEPLEEKKSLDSWIDIRNVKHEEKVVAEYKEDPNHKKAPLAGLREKKHLEKITKDGFRGLGISLLNLGVKKTAEMKKADEEDISD